jgi:dihydrolipoamide dehydrogenase
MTTKIIVLGAGPGGYVAAIRAAQLGADVTVIEQDNVGGTCLNWGCIPSKVMKTTAEILENTQRAQEFGIKLSGEVRADMQTVVARERKVIQDQRKQILKLFQSHKIRYIGGHGHIEDSNLVVVEGPGNKTFEVRWDKLILALGSQPFDIGSIPFDGKKVISSNEALYMDSLPKSMLIVGGGVIGCEFAFIFSALGSRVTVVEMMPRLLPLPSVDEDCSKVLQREMKKRKIASIVRRTIKSVEADGDKCLVTIGDAAGNEELTNRDPASFTLEVEKVLVCVGRIPNTVHTGLRKLGVKTDDNGWIIANEKMETNAFGVYAIGDVLGPSKIRLAHVASAEGRVAAENALGGSHILNYDLVPSAIFTMPEIANVGLTEAQARQQGYNVKSHCVLFRNLGKAQVMGEIAGQAKIVSDGDNGRILGVHLIGPRATDLIAEGTLALKMGCTVRDLAETIHAHPTLSEVMLETSLKAFESPVNR